MNDAVISMSFDTVYYVLDLSIIGGKSVLGSFAEQAVYWQSNLSICEISPRWALSSTFDYQLLGTTRNRIPDLHRNRLFEFVVYERGLLVLHSDGQLEHSYRTRPQEGCMSCQKGRDQFS